MDSEILIIGAGIFGVSTAYHLARTARDPSRITLLDRGSPPSPLAASTDVNKIIRADYSNSLYMELGFEAIEAWKTLPFFRDAGIYHQSGWIAMNETGSDVSARVRKNFRDNGREDVTFDMTEEEVRRSWSGLLGQTDCSPFGSYYSNPSAGWADAGRALKIMEDEVSRMGVNRITLSEAARLVLGEKGIKGVESRSGVLYTADKVLLATGAWTSRLMSSLEDELSIPDIDRVENQVTAAGVCVAHFELGESEAASYRQLPVFVYGGQGEVIPPNDSGVLKFTFSTSFRNTIKTRTGHEISVPPDQSQNTAPQELQDECIKSVRARLPQVLEGGRQVDYYRLCWDSISRNQQPLITRHPDSRLSNLYFAVGGSFHCWKFLPTIGKYVVNVLNHVSNGLEKDQAWSWKPQSSGERGVHESLVPKRELRDFAQ
ncbi:hypothetical protein ASPWEDRAFT_48606 [Aspergillus wentii DTO 134E9]|uniref:FAD dependent oxidoreductase domain-containing protein n=1 Tax=Aspergillus wentii DTO 134E9 TaxID=1073089 RepID=A0A1L9RTU6_ASPWE|nr:uncharacterized protein ASPWEDRAFT_48606 [Aspergillus wentii DTO 134E9]KAI9933985.1 hypothetical protein MW887_005057 [Aspergillus wentii]OJJ38349.1 hypothetical protein ASPWEDRAFT_48606 [Aspergillus wentii DTO 134E9]